MNYLKVGAKNHFPYLNQLQFHTINFDSDSINIQITSNKDVYELVLSSNTGMNEIEAKFNDIYNLIFILLGYFPQIQTYQINEKKEDTSKLLEKYNTSSHFKKSYFLLSNIDNIINNTVLSKFNNIVHTKSLVSVEYLTSTIYEHVISDHKIVLLLQTIDGFIKNSRNESILLKEVERKFGNKATVNYRKRAKKIFSTFFDYHRKYDCKILELLNINERKFIDIICDTRNGLSHLINKGNMLYKGEYIIIYFYITILAIRLFILKELCIPILEENIKESLYVFHDWISEIRYDKNNHILKSNTYNQSQSIDELVAMFNTVKN